MGPGVSNAATSVESTEQASAPKICNQVHCYCYLPMRMLAAHTLGGSMGCESSKADRPSSAMLHRSELCASEPPKHHLGACPCTLAAGTATSGVFAALVLQFNGQLHLPLLLCWVNAASNRMRRHCASVHNQSQLTALCQTLGPFESDRSSCCCCFGVSDILR